LAPPEVLLPANNTILDIGAPDGAGGCICIKKHQQLVLLAIFG
jgi:hypothetical protein